MIRQRIVAFLIVCSLMACHHAPPPSIPSVTTAPIPGTQIRMVGSGPFVPGRGQAALDAFVPDVEADESGGECNLSRTGGSGATLVTAFYPARATSRMQVSVTFDSSGRLVRYSERRGIAHLGPTAGLSPTQLDSVRRTAEESIRSTTLSFDYAIDQAMIMNRGGGKPIVAVLANVRAAEQQKNLGKPAARLERMRRLCGV